MGAYQKRNRRLEKLGYESYEEYLQSNLWNSIRSRVMTRDQQKCRICGGRASNVHHWGYREPTLLGKCLLELWALCRKCHLFIEFEKNGEKAKFGSARRRLKILCRLKGLTFDSVNPRWDGKPPPKRRKRRRCQFCGIRKTLGTFRTTENPVCRKCEKELAIV
jgi:ribosomal protein S14